MKQVSEKFNKQLLYGILVISIVILFRLTGSAIEHSNWNGLVYSSLHVLVVAIGTYLVIKN